MRFLFFTLLALGVTFQKVGGQNVVANFSAETECGSLTVKFKNTSQFGSSFLWYFNPGFSSQLNPSQTFANYGDYAVTLIAYGVNNKTDTITKTIKISDKPQIIPGPEPSEICQGQTTFISVQPHIGYRYSWSPVIGLSDKNIHNPSASPLKSTVYTCYVEDTSTGCFDSINIPVKVVSCHPPKAQFDFDPTVCGSFKVNFKNNSKNNFRNFWNFGDPASGIDDTSSSSNYTLQHLFSGPGTYHVSLIVFDTSGYFSDTFKLAVVVGEVIEGKTSWRDTAICGGDSVFVTTLNPGMTTTWINPDGRGNQQVEGIYLKPGSTTHYKGLVSSNGCHDTVDVQVNVRNFPVFTIIGDSVCFKETSRYKVFPGTGGLTGTFVWDFGDGDTSSLPAPAHYYSKPGLYRVSLTFSSSYGCDTFLFRDFRVFDLPKAEFFSSPAEVFIENPRVRFSAQGDSSNTYMWDFGDGSKAYSKTAIHDYLDTGIYKVTLVTRNTNRCHDTIIREIMVNPRLSLFIPSAFSPNRDGPPENEVFRVFCNHRLMAFNFSIFNRYGQKIFETENQDFIWDGKFKGQDVPAGFYVYKISYRLNATQLANQKGTITVFR